MQRLADARTRLGPASGRSVVQATDSRPVAPPSGRSGTRLGRYELQERLGSGGMGVVYRALDTRLQRSVALKFLSDEFSHDRQAKARFLQEARAASALDHPNICTIYEINEANGHFFLAMAHYQGETLKERIARGPLPVAEALEVAHQVVLGLEAAHERGIVHRDIKPANLWLTETGQVKILDFGLAKFLDQRDHTRTGSSMGTPAYMAPERLRDEKMDARADLWSLGVVLYEALTGKRPFDGSTIPTLIFSILRDTPQPLRTLRPEVPEEVEALVTGLLRKRPAERYPDCPALLEDLLPAGAGALPVTPASPTILPPLAEVAPPPEPPPAEGRDDTADTTETDRTVLYDAQSAPFEQHLTQGLEAALARDYSGAVAAFEEALVLRPGDRRALFNLERVRGRLG